MRIQKLSSRGLVGLVAVFLAMFLMALPAIADSSEGIDEAATSTTVPEFDGALVTDADHDGDADSDPGTAFTEDNDADGVVNNVPDEGDNAHPSGNDRSVEPGGSGNQGNAESTPDQNGHGPERDYEGTDKPNGAGGVDKNDQDGNNGCGNDDDFEDDNEGWCGKPVRDCDNAKHMPKGHAVDCDTPEEECPEGMTKDESGECVIIVKEGKVTLCHATGSTTNPYVKITIAAPAAVNAHIEHQHGEDIIPPFEYKGQTYSQNWTAEGQARYATEDCQLDDEVIVEDEKVTLCHATGSTTNPFVKITIAAPAAVNAHIEHQHGEDIIPPFEYKGQTYSQNWTAEGQALYATEDCQLDDEIVEVPTTTTIPITDNPPTPTTVPEVLGEDSEVGGSLNGEHKGGDKVLGERIVREAREPIAGALERAGGVLPFTGSNILTLLALALGLVGLGLLSLESSILVHNASVRKMHR
ncbi:MAG: hypothetical protein QOH26_737 [Actinomycetota bacterium]|nr:hypothetical protein [Actinomycetota bacterium]